ncbi:DUF6985 domain-containing protein [Taibaiella koreensis]|uniref:DUF6985 domain-containing protein n=1 Tax=Taibaiella koreensis TaxID=1268548 RepID=UPI0019695F92|nr:hypothetical protein [Taibaiella koreensis]
MNGWELEDPGEDILFKRTKKIRDFIKNYPLAAFSRDDSLLMILRRYHPQLNCSTDDPDYPAEGYRMGLACYTATSYTYFILPAGLSYTGISIRYDKDISDFAVTISSQELTRVTNRWELGEKMNNIASRTEAERIAAFAALSNERRPVKKTVPITQTSIDSTVIGTLHQGDFEDWWISEEIAIPFWDGKALPFTFMDLNPNEDSTFIAEADVLLAAFLAKTPIDRLTISHHVYRNCMDFLDAIGYDEDDDALWHMKAPEAVWQFVTCTHMYVSREPYQDKGIYLQLVCRCDWEQEHGLQLVYNKEGRLIRVSASDGHILGWQGDGMIEA